MMGLAEIKHRNSEAAKKARRKAKPPRQFFSEDHLDRHATNIPNFGDHRPEGWTLLDDPEPLFVDATGLGLESEPALTITGYKKRLLELFKEHPEYGYAIIEAGPFQIYIGVFAPEYSDTAGGISA